MKLPLVPMTIVTLGLVACGDTARHSTSPGSSTAVITDVARPAPTIGTPSYSQVDGDKDNDVGASNDDTSNRLALSFGKSAGGSDRRAIVALVRRYYATALAGNSAKACSMVYSTLAEAIPEDYGQPGGPSYMLGVKTCASGMSAVFKHLHAQIAAEQPKLAITHVLLNERHGMVILSFAKLPEREIPVTLEGRRWKMAALFDSPLP